MQYHARSDNEMSRVFRSIGAIGGWLALNQVRATNIEVHENMDAKCRHPEETVAPAPAPPYAVTASALGLAMMGSGIHSGDAL